MYPCDLGMGVTLILGLGGFGWGFEGWWGMQPRERSGFGKADICHSQANGRVKIGDGSWIEGKLYFYMSRSLTADSLVVYLRAIGTDT